MMKLKKENAKQIALKIGWILLIPWAPSMLLYLGVFAFGIPILVIMVIVIVAVSLWYGIYKESKALIIVGLTLCSFEFIGSIIYLFYWIINYIL